MNTPEGIYDIVIIGGGPAGLTAGLYASRGRMNAVLVESLSVMGQVLMTENVENYPGVDKTGGFELIESLRKQAGSFGMKYAQGTVKKITRGEKQGFRLWKVEDENTVYETLSVIIASGASPKKLDIPGEKDFLGKGVSYCATCDGAFFREKEIVVVGGGDTAVEEALFLTRFGRKVTLIHRRDRLRATKILQERALGNEKMNFVWESTVEEISGSDKVGKITVKNVKTGKRTDIPCEGVFIFVGWHPNTDFAKGVVEVTDKQAIIVDSGMKTSQEGIFAAGDCTKKLLHQIVTACGDGATAAYSAQQYVDEVKGVAYR